MSAKNLSSTLFLSCFFLLGTLIGQSEAYTIESVPDPKVSGTGYVSDPNAYLSATDIVTLNQLIASIEDSTTAQIAIVLLPSIGQQVPKDFATDLFELWGIGQANKDNGLLILSVMDQRRTEFETGYGMEAVLTDAQCYRIGMQELVPYFKEDQYGAGLIAAVEKIKTILEDPNYQDDLYDYGRTGRDRGVIPGIPLGFEIYLLILLLFHAIIIALIINVLNSKEDLHDKYLGIKKYKAIIFIFLFPLPYLILYFVLAGILRKLRNQPRYSKLNGKLMHKLDDIEEDAFLSSGQLMEEEIKSVDYDVWVTHEQDDVLILQYLKPFSKYGACPACKFKTYYKAHTQTVVHATYSRAGKRKIVHECKNCGHSKTTYQVIPKKQRSSSSGGSGGGGSSSWGGGSSGGGGAGVSW